MRLPSTTIAVMASLLLATAAVAPGVAAQDEGKKRFGEHPIVGPWVIEADDPASTPSLAIFHPDGSYTFRSGTGVGIGAWEPTGERTADATLLFPVLDEQGEFGGFAVLRSSGEVADDGQALAGTGTVEFPTADGGTTGEIGLTSLTGTRIVVEPVGEPVAPVEE